MTSAGAVDSPIKSGNDACDNLYLQGAADPDYNVCYLRTVDAVALYTNCFILLIIRAFFPSIHVQTAIRLYDMTLTGASFP